MHPRGSRIDGSARCFEDQVLIACGVDLQLCRLKRKYLGFVALLREEEIFPMYDD
jgi:hypothetical protein